MSYAEENVGACIIDKTYMAYFLIFLFQIMSIKQEDIVVSLVLPGGF
jgi:hypothetical protein